MTEKNKYIVESLRETAVGLTVGGAIMSASANKIPDYIIGIAVLAFGILTFAFGYAILSATQKKELK